MQVAVITWIQRRVPPVMLGRTMSILMFIIMGLTPLSAALAGWLMPACCWRARRHWPTPSRRSAQWPIPLPPQNGPEPAAKRRMV